MIIIFSLESVEMMSKILFIGLDSFFEVRVGCKSTVTDGGVLDFAISFSMGGNFSGIKHDIRFVVQFLIT